MSEHSSILRAHRAPQASLVELTGREDLFAADAVQLSMADGTPPPAHLATSVVCFWDETSLSVLFRAQYLRLRTLPAGYGGGVVGKTLHLWEQSDVLEVFIGREVRSVLTYGEFQVAPDGRWLDSRVRLDEEMILLDTAWESGLRVASVIDVRNNLWRAGMEIPWSAFGTAPPSTCRWDMNCYRATGRFHGDELLAWSPTGYGEGCFHRPDRFGVLEVIRE